jgi:branched-chain amino acid transport system substrate-binding protein
MTPTKTAKPSFPPIFPIGLAFLVSGLIWLGKCGASDPQVSAIQKRMSMGQRVLITADATTHKQKGIQNFDAGDYQAAITAFQDSLRQNPNDPETLIYLNNATIQTGTSKGLTIAVSVPISSNLNVAQEILRGAAQAQQEINAQGIHGQGLSIQIVDDQNDPEIVQQVATELTQDPKILAVIGHNASDASLAAAPIYQQAGLVMVSPTSFANQLSGFGDYIFRAVPNTRFMAEPLAKYVVKTAHKTRMVTCYDSQSKDNASFRDEFVASLVAQGGQLITTHCDFGSPNWNPETAVAEAIRNGADSLLLAPHIDRLDRAMDLAQAVKGKLTLFGSSTLYTFKTVQSGQSAVNGLVLPVPWHPATAKAKTFAQQAHQRWGGVVNWRTATAYDATKAVIEGLQQIASGSETRSALQRALKNPDFSTFGAGETVKFLPTGDRISTPLLIQVRPHNDSYDFVPLQAN